MIITDKRVWFSVWTTASIALLCIALISSALPIWAKAIIIVAICVRSALGDYLAQTSKDLIDLQRQQLVDKPRELNDARGEQSAAAMHERVRSWLRGPVERFQAERTEQIVQQTLDRPVVKAVAQWAEQASARMDKFHAELIAKAEADAAQTLVLAESGPAMTSQECLTKLLHIAENGSRDDQELLWDVVERMKAKHGWVVPAPSQPVPRSENDETD